MIKRQHTKKPTPRFPSGTWTLSSLYYNYKSQVFVDSRMLT